MKRKIKLSSDFIAIPLKNTLKRRSTDYYVGQEVELTDDEKTDFGKVVEVKDKSILVKWNYTPSPIEYLESELEHIKPV